MKTEEGNKLIAEFMGYKSTVEGLWTKMDKFMFVLSYDFSWSELMAVVTKIEALSELEDFEVCINKVTVSIHGKSIPKLLHIHENATSIFRVVGEEDKATKKITCLWECIVEFLQWYNTTLTSKK